MDGVKSFFGRLRLDKHHKIEQFGIVFCVFVLLFVAIFGISVKIHVSNKNITLTSQAVYTQNAQFSLSEEEINVLQVFRNDDYTKAFVLLEVDGHDMSRLSTQAADYQILMTGYNGKLTGGTPTGAIYMFGADGYIGLYFANPTGFDSQLYDVVLRNIRSPWLTANKPDPETLNPENYPGVSYMYNNQMHFYANFAGTDGVVADFLNADTFTLNEMYACVMSNARQDEIKTEIATNIAALNNDMNQINAWADALNNANIVTPALPACISGDMITAEADEANNPMYYSSAMDSVPLGSFAPLVSVARTEGVEDDDLYLVTDYVFQGGIQYNYQPIGLYDDVTSILVGDGTYSDFNLTGSYAEWESFRTLHTASMPSVEHMFTYFDNTGHMLTDADVHAQVSDGQSIDARQNAVAGFEAAVAQYIADKYNYQVNLLPSLIAEKASTENRTRDYTARFDADTLVVY